MLDQHGHLLVRDETLERLPRLPVDRRLDDGPGPVPVDARGEGEQVAHEGGLARELHLDGAVAEARVAALLDVELVALDGAHGVVQRQELDVGVLRLGRDPLHDDVHRLLAVVEDPRVAPEEGDDLGALGAEWDLGGRGRERESIPVSIGGWLLFERGNKCCRGYWDGERRTYILHLDDAVSHRSRLAAALHEGEVLGRQSDVLRRQAGRALREPVELLRAHGADLGRNRASRDRSRDQCKLVVLRNRRLVGKSLRDGRYGGPLGRGRRREGVRIRRGRLRAVVLPRGARGDEMEMRRGREVYRHGACARRKVARLGAIVKLCRCVRSRRVVLASLLGCMRGGLLEVPARVVSAQSGSMDTSRYGGLLSTAGVVIEIDRKIAAANPDGKGTIRVSRDIACCRHACLILDALVHGAVLRGVTVDSHLGIDIRLLLSRQCCLPGYSAESSFRTVTPAWYCAALVSKLGVSACPAGFSCPRAPWSFPLSLGGT